MLRLYCNLQFKSVDCFRLYSHVGYSTLKERDLGWFKYFSQSISWHDLLWTRFRLALEFINHSMECIIFSIIFKECTRYAVCLMNVMMLDCQSIWYRFVSVSCYQHFVQLTFIRPKSPDKLAVASFRFGARGLADLCSMLIRIPFITIKTFSTFSLESLHTFYARETGASSFNTRPVFEFFIP